MHLPTLAKYLLLAWVLPAALVVIAKTATPDPGRPRSDFQAATFTPSRIWTTENEGTKGSDFFELRLAAPDGKVFFHRDPNPGPIRQLDAAVPRGQSLSILYETGREGNILMEITAGSTSFLSFAGIMAEYAARRRLIYLVAAIWWTLANLLSWAMWKAGRRPAAT